MSLYFSDQFGVGRDEVEAYGAFDISLLSDVPLFIDPFLLYKIAKPGYKDVHDSMFEYLCFLRDLSSETLSEDQIKEWFLFREVKQNWLGFSFLNNRGRGPGRKFATDLIHGFSELNGADPSPHLERFRLLKMGIGVDGISDFAMRFATKLLAEYTQSLAISKLRPDQCAEWHVPNTSFDYEERRWEGATYYLPTFDDDFVLLTPRDILTKGDTILSATDMRDRARNIIDACENPIVREKTNRHIQAYLERVTRRPPDDKRPPRRATPHEEELARQDAVDKISELVDVYIRLREQESAETATYDAAKKVRDATELFADSVLQMRSALGPLSRFFTARTTGAVSYNEALERCRAFKTFVESQDGHRLFNRVGSVASDEKDVQLAFALLWYDTKLDVNREVNNGRGPVDFKISYGRGDKCLVELKLASNAQLKRNLQNQVAIYQDANDGCPAIKMIVFFTGDEERKLQAILDDLDLTDKENVVVIDSRNDNKPSASKA